MCGSRNLKSKDVLPSFSTESGNKPFKNAFAFKLEFGCSSVSVLADVCSDWCEIATELNVQLDLNQTIMILGQNIVLFSSVEFISFQSLVEIQGMWFTVKLNSLSNAFFSPEALCVASVLSRHLCERRSHSALDQQPPAKKALFQSCIKDGQENSSASYLISHRGFIYYFYLLKNVYSTFL